MTRHWIGVGAGLLAGMVLAGVIAAAPTKVAAPVEVINFPASQGVEGTVSIGNFPVVQGVEVHGQVPVTGQVEVGNLPLDPQGRVLVAQEETSLPSATMDIQVLESDKDILGNLPLIALPQDFHTAIVSVQSLDITRARVDTFSLAFGSVGMPLVHTGLGDAVLFPITLEASGNSAATAAISGSHLQIKLRTFQATSGNPAPPDAVYFLHIYLRT
jgi:hypothetical protein